MHVFFMESLFENKREIARAIGFKYSTITRIVYAIRVDNCYEQFEVQKKNGGVRRIAAPKGQLKTALKRLSKIFLDRRYKDKKERFQDNYPSHGFERDRSIFSNALRHINKKIVVNMDIEDFFGSIHFGRVVGLFENNYSFRCPRDVAVFLANLVTYKGVLPQGAPTSPVIANYFGDIIDSKILKIAKKYKLYYTRYADDLTFSTNDLSFMEIADHFIDDIRVELERLGFKSNNKKTRIAYYHTKQQVTGLTVNQNISCDVDYYKKTRAMAHQLYKFGQFQINNVPGSLEQLEGRLWFIEHSLSQRVMSKKSKYNGKKKTECLRGEYYNNRLQEIRKFLFYKYFYMASLPVIATEGPSDQSYLIAALQKYHERYPSLVSKSNEGDLSFNFKFLNRTQRLQKYLGIAKDGGDSLKKIVNIFTDRIMRPDFGDNGRGMYNYFVDKGYIGSNQPILLLVDSEFESSSSPVKSLMKVIPSSIKEEVIKSLKNQYYCSLHPCCPRVYVLVIPKSNHAVGKTEIEDLLNPEELKSINIKGRLFSRDENYDKTIYFGKVELGKYILNNYREVDLSGFLPLLDIINEIVSKSQTVK